MSVSLSVLSVPMTNGFVFGIRMSAVFPCRTHGAQRGISTQHRPQRRSPVPFVLHAVNRGVGYFVGTLSFNELSTSTQIIVWKKKHSLSAPTICKEYLIYKLLKFDPRMTWRMHKKLTKECIYSFIIFIVSHAHLIINSSFFGICIVSSSEKSGIIKG